MYGSRQATLDKRTKRPDVMIRICALHVPKHPLHCKPGSTMTVATLFAPRSSKYSLIRDSMVELYRTTRVSLLTRRPFVVSMGLRVMYVGNTRYAIEFTEPLGNQLNPRERYPKALLSDARSAH